VNRLKYVVLPRNAVRIVLSCAGRNGCGLPPSSARSALQHRGGGCCCRLGRPCAPCARTPGIIDDVERHRAVLRRRQSRQDRGNLLRCRERNLIAVKDVTRSLAADYEFLGRLDLGRRGGDQSVEPAHCLDWGSRAPKRPCTSGMALSLRPAPYRAKISSLNAGGCGAEPPTPTHRSTVVDDDGKPARIRKQAELHLLNVPGSDPSSPHITELARRANPTSCGSAFMSRSRY